MTHAFFREIAAPPEFQSPLIGASVMTQTAGLVEHGSGAVSIPSDRGFCNDGSEVNAVMAALADGFNPL